MLRLFALLVDKSHMPQLQLDGNVVLVFVAVQLLLLGLTRRKITHWRAAADQAVAAAEEEVAAVALRFWHSFECSLIPSFVMSTDMRVVRVNAAFVEFTELPERWLVGKTISEIVGQELGEAAAQRMRVAFESDRQFGQAFVEMERPDGSPLIYRETFTVMPATRQLDCQLSVQLEDVTEQQLSRVELQKRALHDSLTGLPNRSLLLERLNATLAKARIGDRLALAFLDLDNFKSINDQLGHAAGDDLMIVVAKRLAEAVGRAGVVARFGGDEFVVLFTEVKSALDALNSAERVRGQVSRPVLLEGREVDLTISLGLTVGTTGDAAKVLLREADSALYRSKEAGKNRSVLYDPSVEPERLVTSTLESQLARAIRTGEMSIEFEPVFSFPGMAKVGLSTGARWEHPELGSLGTREIVALAEQAGLRVPFEFWLQSATMSAFHQLVTVERQMWWLVCQVSIDTLCDEEFVESITESLSDWDVAPSRLLLEISDAVFTHRERAYNELIGPIRELGVRVMIRETGRGVCISRSATARYDALSLDRTILSTVSTASRGDAILQAFTYSGAALGVPTILRNLDTEELVNLARDAGATFVSGKALREVESSPAPIVPSYLN